MTNTPAEQGLLLRIESSSRANIYLSTSWQPDKGVDLAYRLVRSLDQASIRVVGDVKKLPTQEEGRIRRVMADCDGLLCVLPFRPAEPSRTSPYMLAELRTAAAMGFPVAILHDQRVSVEQVTDERDVTLIFADESEPVVISRLLLSCLCSYDVDVPGSEAAAEAAIVPFRERVAPLEGSKRDRRIPAYAFLITRLKDDFRRARHAIAAAVESATGLPCIWVDAPSYSNGVSDTVQRTQLLIQHAQFVVADLSLSEESPQFDNPSRAHEVGVAVAFGKKLFVISQGPRRDPYHALAVTQVVFWSDEEDLFRQLYDSLYAERETIARHTYNWDLPRPGDSYTPQLTAPTYRNDEGKPYLAPSASELSSSDRWVLAVCFACSALAASVLVDRYTGFGDTFDFAAIVGAVFACIFSPDLNRLLRRQLARNPLLRYAVLGATLVLLLALIFAGRPLSSS